MIKLRFLGFVSALVLASLGYAQSNDIASGNMHFDAKDMDTNGDHMISLDEMQKYGEKMWDMMAKGKDTIPVELATKDFASGGVNFSARDIDTNHDGSISKTEFLAYTAKKFDGMKKTSGMVSMDDMSTAFARGNTPAGH